MGTIVKRPRKSGGMAYMAKIVLKKDGKIIHRESKTLETYRAADAWMKRRESELAVPGEIDRAKKAVPTLADAIDKYTTESAKKIGRTKAQVLDAIKKRDIATLPCNQITAQDITALAAELSKSMQPATVQNYISHLAAIFAIARPAWGIPLDHGQMRDAFVVTRRLGLTGKSTARDRRPTLDELDRIMTHFQRRSATRQASAPMHKIVAFALFSTRRQEEITQIKWADFDRDRVLVRDMKHPGDKIGNDVWCDLPPEAVAIVNTMPRTSECIFPYSTDAISAAFTRACHFLAIEDLRFHDLRHEGVSRLFEMGWNIPHVAAVSGHRSWGSLKRYTHVRQSGDKYAGWPWLETLTTPAPPV